MAPLIVFKIYLIFHRVFTIFITYNITYTFARGVIEKMRERLNFIPKPYKKDQVSVRIEIETLEKIDRLAAKIEVSRSELICQCIDFALEHLHRDDHNRE